MITGTKTFSPSILATAILAAGAFSSSAIARGPDLPVELLGGEVLVEGVVVGANGQEAQRDGGQSLNVDLGFNALGFAGEARLNGIWKQADFGSNTFRYGDRVKPGNESYVNGGDAVEVYSFSASRLGETADLHLFYHVPRFHWGYEGDAFGLLRETTDMPKQDIWNSKAPSGLEIVGKESLDGLKILAGDEIYWGANPMIMAKYQFGAKDQYSVMAASDYKAGINERKLSLQGTFDLGESATLLLGALRSGDDKVGDTYIYEKNGQILSDTISDSDTFALKARVNETLSGGVTAYAEFNHAGLVADAGEHQEIFDTELPYTDTGNKRTIELGGQLIDGNWMYFPRLFARRNLVEGLSTQAQDAAYRRATRASDQPVVSPFAVVGNREVDAVEFYVTYDPTPNTYFYEWDNYLKEDAPIAFNLGFTHLNFKGKGDAFVSDGGLADAGRQPEIINKITSRVGINPTSSLRVYADLALGDQQPVQADKESNYFSSVDLTAVYNSANIITAGYAKDKFGEYDFQAVQGIKFNHQIHLGYERILEIGAGGSKVGLRGERRKSDTDGSSYELSAYISYTF